MNSDEALRQQDAAAQRRFDDAHYRATNTRPLSILKMLASDPGLSEDMARVLDSVNLKADVRKYSAEVAAPSAFGVL